MEVCVVGRQQGVTDVTPVIKEENKPQQSASGLPAE